MKNWTKVLKTLTIGILMCVHNVTLHFSLSYLRREKNLLFESNSTSLLIEKFDW